MDFFQVIPSAYREFIREMLPNKMSNNSKDARVRESIIKAKLGFLKTLYRRSSYIVFF